MKSTLKTLLYSIIASFIFTSCQKDVVNNVLSSPPIANAGNPQTIQLPAPSFTLTGSGTTTNGSIVGYLWSLVSGPNVPVILTPGNRITLVNNIVAGRYILQLMVIDEAGLTGVDTVSIQVNPSAIQTLTLQPANNPYDVHLAILGSTNVTDNNSSEFSGGAWTSGGIPFYTRGAYKFDLSPIPANATILSAKLSIFSDPVPLNGNLIDANSGTANALYIERITSNWNPATVTWQTQPATDIVSQVSIPHTNLPFLDLVDVDVKNLVTPMVATNNYGFMIRLQNESIYNIRIFCSSRHTIAAKHPKLVVTYQ